MTRERDLFKAIVLSAVAMVSTASCGGNDTVADAGRDASTGGEDAGAADAGAVVDASSTDSGPVVADAGRDGGPANDASGPIDAGQDSGIVLII